jgi:hypothetical protein
MNRGAPITLRVLFVPVAAVSAFALYQAMLGATPWLDARAFPYGYAVIGAFFQTLVAATVAALVAFPAQWLYGRFAWLVAVTVMVPILREASPWNSTYHDFRWSGLDWALAFYECTTVVLLTLWFAALASRVAKGSNHRFERSRDRSSV